MRYLDGTEAEDAERFIGIAAEEAKKSCCLRSQCGAIVVKGGKVIGRGFNSPPGNKKPSTCFKDDLPEDFISDRTCCIHAEDRAVRDTLINNKDKIRGSRIYFIRLKDGKITRAGKPYCTMCSKMVLDAGIAEFVLWHKEGICIYDTGEYNELSFKYRKELNSK